MNSAVGGQRTPRQNDNKIMSEIFSSEIVLIGDDESANVQVGSDDSRNVGGISSSLLRNS